MHLADTQQLSFPFSICLPAFISQGTIHTHVPVHTSTVRTLNNCIILAWNHDFTDIHTQTWRGKEPTEYQPASSRTGQQHGRNQFVCVHRGLPAAHILSSWLVHWLSALPHSLTSASCRLQSMTQFRLLLVQLASHPAHLLCTSTPQSPPPPPLPHSSSPVWGQLWGAV